MIGLNDAADFLVLFAFIPALIFVLLYLPRPWWGNPAGRASMTLSVVLTAVLGLILMQRWGFDLPKWVWLGGYAAIAAALWVQLGGFITVIFGGRGTVDAVPDPEEEASHGRARRPQRRG